MSISRLEYLFEQYVNQKCSLQEEEELMELFAQSENERAVKILIEKVIENTGPELQMTAHLSNSILQNIFQAEKGLVVPIKKKKIVLSMWFRVAAAAIIVLLVTATYWFVEKKIFSEGAIVAKKPMQILPGGVKALLTIDNGGIIPLDSIQSGKIAQQGNTAIYKKDGVLEYNTNASANNNVSVTYNTLSTPGGGQYKLILPDGSKVWLNAKSRLRFPAAFTGNQRLVELTGEAYFEVAKNKENPFMINVEGLRVEVLGTHFNVNGYVEEKDIVTSLIEGSVKVTKGALQDLLKPGQQAILNKKEEQIKIANADMDEVTAWKNGLFQFKNADIYEIMREVGRWYNVEIIYAGKVPVQRFDGKISRSAQLPEVLQILQLSKIKFTIEGKKIIVH